MTAFDGRHTCGAMMKNGGSGRGLDRLAVAKVRVMAMICFDFEVELLLFANAVYRQCHSFPHKGNSYDFRFGAFERLSSPFPFALPPLLTSLVTHPPGGLFKTPALDVGSSDSTSVAFGEMRRMKAAVHMRPGD